ncbi:MAG: hypothetical protein ACRDL6_00505, partial [Solirubrobacterales bacterium]
AAALVTAPAASAEPNPGCKEFGNVVSNVVTTYYTGKEPQFEVDGRGYRWGHAVSDLAHAFEGDPFDISRAGLCPR